MAAASSQKKEREKEEEKGGLEEGYHQWLLIGRRAPSILNQIIVRQVGMAGRGIVVITFYYLLKKN